MKAAYITILALVGTWTPTSWLVAKCSTPTKLWAHMKPDALYSSLLLGTPAATKHCCLQTAAFRYRFSTGAALQRNPPPKLKESLGYYVHIYIPLPHRCGCLHRCKWEGYSPTSQTALQVPLRILFGVTILEIVRTQSARFLPSCFGIGGGGIPTSRQQYISSLKWCSALLVRVKGYDPSIPYGQWFLRPFCIPIPTHSHLKCISLFPGHQRQWVRHNHEFQKLIRFTQSY